MKSEQKSTPELVNAKAASKILGVAEGTLRYWRCIGIGPKFVKYPQRVLYDVEDLRAYIDECRQVPAVRAVLNT
jgi:DNA-binding transcriptional MerR regulator